MAPDHAIRFKKKLKKKSHISLESLGALFMITFLTKILAVAVNLFSALLSQNSACDVIFDK